MFWAKAPSFRSSSHETTVIIRSEDIIVRHLYEGPGRGCACVMTCEALDFTFTWRCEEGGEKAAFKALHRAFFRRLRAREFGSLLGASGLTVEALDALYDTADDALAEYLGHPVEALVWVCLDEMLSRGLFDVRVYSLLGTTRGLIKEWVVELIRAQTR